MTPVLIANITVLLRDEKSSRREIEASERRTMRQLVKEIFLVGAQQPVLRDSSAFELESYKSSLSSSDTRATLPSASPACTLCFLLEDSSRLKLATTEAFDRLHLADSWFSGRATACYQPADTSVDVSVPRANRQGALISPSLCEDLLEPMHSTSDIRNDDWPGLRNKGWGLNFNEGNTTVASQGSRLQYQAADRDETEYYCSALGATVYRDLTVAPVNTSSCRMVFGVGAGGPTRASRGPLIIAGRLLRHDVVVLINGSRIWTLDDVRLWEDTMVTTEVQYVTVLRNHQKVHIRVGLE